MPCLNAVDDQSRLKTDFSTLDLNADWFLIFFIITVIINDHHLNVNGYSNDSSQVNYDSNIELLIQNDSKSFLDLVIKFPTFNVSPFNQQSVNIKCCDIFMTNIEGFL